MFAKILIAVLALFGVAVATPRLPLHAPPIKLETAKSIATSTAPRDFTRVKLRGEAASQSPATSSPTKIAKTPPKITTEKPKVASASPLPTSPPAENLPKGTNLQIKIELPPPTPKPPVNWSEINGRTREALVNIICTSKSGGSFEPITGSGVIIDSRGVILTNAHVAQYLLLKDFLQKDFLDCLIRRGNPARAAHRASILFISPLWVEENYLTINLEEQPGTGENDFALLQITSNTDPDLLLPQDFPFVKVNTNDLESEHAPLLLAAYPAAFLGGIAIQRDLYPVSTITNIKRVYTFGSGTPDVVSTGGNPTAQRGSSGGAVVDEQGALIGLISTEVSAKTTAETDLNAITASHINRSLLNQTGLTLSSFLAGDLTKFAEDFNRDTIPRLTKLLVGELNKRVK